MGNRNPVVILLGSGDKVVNHGTFGGEHCVFVCDAKERGEIGASASSEHIADDELGENPVVIVTRNEKIATLVYMAITGQLDDIEVDTK